MLFSLVKQSRRPDQVVIVDGGSESVEGVVANFPELPIDYLQCHPPSASRQRNMGIQRVGPDMEFVGFLDDDIILDSGAVEAMMRFWERASAEVVGAAFNMTNHPSLAIAGIKESSLAERLGVYSSRKGAVLPSGFQTMIGIVAEDQEVDWIPTTASVWRRPFVGPDSFDEWFSGYSYLEDLDFSYGVRKNHRLAVIAEARYQHLPAPSGRGNGFVFGRREVRNRLYFVKKHGELSVGRCYLTLVLRTFMSLWFSVRKLDPAFLARALGNMLELANPFKGIRMTSVGEKHS